METIQDIKSAVAISATKDIHGRPRISEGDKNNRLSVFKVRGATLKGINWHMSFTVTTFMI